MAWRVEKGPKVGIRRPRESLGDTELSLEQGKALLNAGLLKPQHCQADGVPVISRSVEAAVPRIRACSRCIQNHRKAPTVPPGS